MADKKENFIFVSYSHKDSAVVYPIIETLKKNNFNVWYDSGIEAGSKWSKYIADKITKSQVVIVMLSKNAEESQYCSKEINFAIACRKNMLVVYVEEYEPSDDMKFLLGDIQDIRMANFNNNEAFYDYMTHTEILQPCKTAATEIPEQTVIADEPEIQKSNYSILAEIDKYKNADGSGVAQNSNVNTIADVPQKQQTELPPVAGNVNKEKSEEKPATPSSDTSVKKSEKPVGAQSGDKPSTAGTAQQTSGTPEKKKTEEPQRREVSDKPPIISAIPRMPKTFDKDKFVKRVVELKMWEEQKKKALGKDFDICKVIDEYNKDAKHRICYKKELKPKQIENALKYIATPYSRETAEDVVGLMDMTVLFSGKEGFVFTKDLLYWRYMGETCSVILRDVIGVKKTDSCTIFYMYDGDALGIKDSTLFDVYRFAEILLKHREFVPQKGDLSEQGESKIKRAICYANKMKFGDSFKRDDGFHFTANLTEKQKENALKYIVKTKSKEHCEILALYDMSKSKTGKEGIAITIYNEIFYNYAGRVDKIDFASILAVSFEEDSGQIRVKYKDGNKKNSFWALSHREVYKFPAHTKEVYNLLAYLTNGNAVKTNGSDKQNEKNADNKVIANQTAAADVPYVANAIKRYNDIYPNKISTNSHDFPGVVKEIIPYVDVDGLRISHIEGFWKDNLQNAKYLFTKDKVYWCEHGKVGEISFCEIHGLKVVKGSHISIVSHDGSITGIKTYSDFDMFSFIAAVMEEKAKVVSDSKKICKTSAAFAASLANKQVYNDYYIPGNVEMFLFKTNISRSKKSIFRFITVVEPKWVLDGLVAFSDTSGGRGETGCWITEKGMYCIASGKHHLVMYDKIDSVKINGCELSITYKESEGTDIIYTDNADLVYRFLINLTQNQTNK